ncbi:hypothetical protein [Nocardia sp. N2S4-5]|uniref:hypothetical protein n=1 Tax=Nocardia sp. N2S4-5 TaxID=3351565 RepID=UPI0037CD8E45
MPASAAWIADAPEPAPASTTVTAIAEPSSDRPVFADANDRLVRQLFEVGLQLHTLCGVFDRSDATAPQMRAAGAAVGEVLEELDILIRDAGLDMLAATVGQARTDGRRADGRRRRGRR